MVGGGVCKALSYYFLARSRIVWQGTFHMALSDRIGLFDMALFDRIGLYDMALFDRTGLFLYGSFRQGRLLQRFGLKAISTDFVELLAPCFSVRAWAAMHAKVRGSFR